MYRDIPMGLMPKISCLCISYKRAHYLKGAIECFLQQTYPEKELVVVHNINDLETVNLLRSKAHSQITAVGLIPNGKHFSIGELRNIAIESSTGNYVCTWDDDDWHHPKRLDTQFKGLDKFKKNASLLTKILMYDKTRNLAYLSLDRCWENTIMVERKFLDDHGIRFQHINRAEDYYLINELIRHNCIYPMMEPTLYIYQATGTNTCDYGHFDWLFNKSELLQPYQTLVIQKSISGEFEPHISAQKMLTANFLQSLRFVPESDSRI